jgi:ferredoxin/flavodoxin---NADP+ reductase
MKENPKGRITPTLREVKPGDKLDLTGPYGEFFYRQDEACRHVFLATGIGISPFRSFLRSYDIPNYLIVHGIRHQDDLRLSEGLDPAHLVSCISQEVGGTFRGRITDYLQSTDLDPRDLYYLCGNPIAVKDIAAVLLGKGIPDDRLVREFYYAY